MRYILKDNKTGREYIETFQESDFPESSEAREAIKTGKEPTKEQAQQQLSIWNRSQVHFRQEFTYSLAPEHPNQFPVIIDSPGDYRTRNGKRVTIHLIAVKKAGDDCMEFCAKGSFWKSHYTMGTNPEYGIWHVSGLSRGIGIHPNDIIQKW